MNLERSELSVEQLREIVGLDYRLLIAHQKATLEYLSQDGAISETLLEPDSFIPRKSFRGTETKISEKRQQELMRLCGNVALYDDEIEDSIDENKSVAAIIELKQKLPNDQCAINAFRACRSVAVLGIVLSQDTQSEAAHAPTKVGERSEPVQAVA